MIEPHKYISYDEYDVINKFLALYRNKSIIVADRYTKEFSTVPLKNGNIILKTDEEVMKTMYFCRTIDYKGEQYVVELEISDVIHFNQKHQKINMFKISTNESVHSIDQEIYSDIWSIFLESQKRIISPEQPYCKKMYSNKALEKFLMNHEWENIEKGIQQKPTLANSLFITGEEYRSSMYDIYFATILYQLIDFRIRNLEGLIKDEKDLYELDKLIVRLRRAKLLKIHLSDQISGSKLYPKKSILLDHYNENLRTHEVTQYNGTNNGLSAEKSVLKKLVKDMK